MAVGRLIGEALDPVLVRAGFQAGQYSDDDNADRDQQVIFCAGHDDLSSLHPHLPQAHQQGPGTACVDLVVHVQPDGTLVALDLEGMSLQETLRRVGLVSEAEALAKHLGSRSTESLTVVHAVLERLLDPSTDWQ